MIEIRHLRSFVEVATTLHFGQAAQRLNIAQPALSRQVQLLEDRLGVSLLARTQRKVALTAAGRVFLTRARRILDEVEDAAAEARRVASGQEGYIRIGFIHSSTYGLTPGLIRRFRDSYPAVVLDLHEMPIHEQIEALLEGTIDVGVLRPPLADPRLSSHLLKSERFVIALPENHRLAGWDALALGRLAEETFIFFAQDRSPLFFETIGDMCREAGFTPRVEQYATQIHTMLGLVAAGVGIAVLPEVARNLAFPGVAFAEIEGERRSVDVALGWRSRDDNPAVKAFVAMTEAGSDEGKT